MPTGQAWAMQSLTCLRGSMEKELISPVSELKAFLESELDRLESYQGSPELHNFCIEPLNSPFRVSLS